MLKLRQIAYASLVSTSRFPRWWILALAQIIAFSLVGQLSRFDLLHLPFVFWLVVGLMALMPVTVWLWLDIQAIYLKSLRQAAAQIFIRKCLSAGIVMLGSVILTMLIRQAYPAWVFLAVVSSLVAATAALAMLYIVLCEQSVPSALALALDTWHKKISLAVAAAFILIFAHGVSFTLVHSIWKSFKAAGQFSVSSHSATIWVLLLVLLAIVVFFAAVLNCFLVFLFLEIIRRKKDPEIAREEVVAKQPIFQANS